MRPFLPISWIAARSRPRDVTFPRWSEAKARESRSNDLEDQRSVHFPRDVTRNGGGEDQGLPFIGPVRIDARAVAVVGR